ncbi:MAG: radical SAM protein [Proteobacteria bacterium]|nr:radical SAM protein [Pseudomonadota bacterium]
MESQNLLINEIFYSIQGESSQAGRPSVFVRLSGCPLRCTWCDTAYAFNEGQKKSFSEILNEIKKYPTRLVEVTGGEPLAQKNSIEFLRFLEDEAFEIMLETSGAYSIQNVPKSVKIIMDLKAPASGESHRNLWDNMAWLKAGIDEIKFVVQNKEDFDFALNIEKERNLTASFVTLISPVFGKIDYKELAQWILESGRPFRMQIQMHKFIWSPEARGV